MESRFIAGKGYARAAGATVALADCRERRMQCVVAAGLALLGLVALMPRSARADATSSPGKNAAAASAVNLSVTNVSSPITVQLTKGRTKRLLVVHGVISGYASTPGTMLSLAVQVNGVDSEPNDHNYAQIVQDGCHGFCTISGTWWLDLDAMELAHPGQFINVPLDVSLRAQTWLGNLDGAKVSVTATLVKK